ncbi:MAG: hypothetical protein MJ135_00800 [Oscillospiraceae bacterium]|nr:hypothetical protein [Oscillospiraceae bacterium]
MKQKSFLCLALSTMLLLSGCGQKSEEPVKQVQTVPAETETVVTETEIQTPEEAQPNLEGDWENKEAVSGIKVQYEVVSEDFDAPEDNTQKILVFSYEIPHVDIPECPEAAEEINDCLRLQGELFYTGSSLFPGVNQMLESALDNYTYVTQTQAEIGVEFSDVLSAGTERLDDAIISFQYHEVTYAGGSNIQTRNSGLTFDAATGARLQLEDLSDEPELFCAFLASCKAEDISALQEMRDYFIAANEDCLWYLDRDGLTLVAQDGFTLMDRIPYETLEGHMKEKYMPKELTEPAGLSVGLVDENGENAVISDQVTIDDNGLNVLFSFRGTAAEVGLFSVQYDSFSDSFFNDRCYWACSQMTNCAIQVETVIPETLPNLMIQYTDSEGTHNYFLAESGKDGSLLLIPNAIEILG